MLASLETRRTIRQLLQLSFRALQLYVLNAALLEDGRQGVEDDGSCTGDSAVVVTVEDRRVVLLIPQLSQRLSHSHGLARCVGGGNIFRFTG